MLKEMTEKEKLESYITDGFKTHMVIRTMSVGEIKLHLPEAYWDKRCFLYRYGVKTIKK